MSDEELLAKIKVILNITNTSDKDELLQIYIDNAKSFIQDYCHITEFPASFASIIVQMCVCEYRLKGAEGLKSGAKGALIETYMTEYPPNILNRLNPFRRIRVI